MTSTLSFLALGDCATVHEGRFPTISLGGSRGEPALQLVFPSKVSAERVKMIADLLNDTLAEEVSGAPADHTRTDDGMAQQRDAERSGQ
jgi:hypothetical protein